MTEDKAFFSYLHEQLTDSVAHAKGTLYEHLLGTYTLLRAWGADEAVCRAGLFHSVYGTNVFTTRSIPPTGRAKVVALIGKNAEHLVFLFSRIERPERLLETLENCHVVDMSTKEFELIQKKEVVDIVTIEIANLIEQGGSKELMRLFLEKIVSTDTQIPPKAVAALSARVKN